MPGSELPVIRGVLRRSLRWGLTAAAATASLDALLRALCLPPHWRWEMALRCRGDELGAALLRAFLDAGVTTLLTAPSALLVGAVVGLAWGGKPQADWRRPLAATALGVVLWLIAMGRMEPGYLDASVSDLATILGALLGAAALWRSRAADDTPRRPQGRHA